MQKCCCIAITCCIISISFFISYSWGDCINIIWHISFKEISSDACVPFPLLLCCLWWELVAMWMIQNLVATTYSSSCLLILLADALWCLWLYTHGVLSAAAADATPIIAPLFLTWPLVSVAAPRFPISNAMVVAPVSSAIGTAPADLVLSYMNHPAASGKSAMSSSSSSYSTSQSKSSKNKSDAAKWGEPVKPSVPSIGSQRINLVSKLMGGCWVHQSLPFFLQVIQTYFLRLIHSPFFGNQD